MGGYAAQIGLVVLLVVVNAALAGTEIALVTLRAGQIARLEAGGPGGRAVARLARDPNRFLATIQIGITLAGFLASATAAVTLAQPLVGPLGFLGDAAGPVAVVLVTVVLTFFTLVFGELAPKRIAMQRAEAWAVLAARPLDLLGALSRPVVWLLGIATDLVVRVLGGDPRSRGEEEIGEEELRDMVSGHRGMTPTQRTIITGALELSQRRLRHVLVPRREVDAVSAATPSREAARTLAERGHSRAPVVQGDELDDVVGVVHWCDLLLNDDQAGAVARPPMLLPDTLGVPAAFQRMTAERQQLAVVIGEAGEVAGIVSLEDLLEEIVGEIYDETDSDVRGATRLEDGSIRLPGTFPVHDLPDVGVHPEDLPDGSYVTVAGLVIAHLGHIPEAPGETVDIGGWLALVAATEGRAVTEVILTPDVAEAGEDAAR
ncbi:HlyC/CorC family transporter [Nocardiopsis sp. CNT-189]|uniref:hemolysin family protein n=1 Tax=Nocardiopsis oceanisediminis TaxID=2816862 RepID=UPI003B310212